MTKAPATKPTGICAFCDSDEPLRESHVLPAFVFRWLRGRSGTGHMRNTDNPNRRVQDGLKLPRSEEHTSELQSLMRISYAVFCLKKKKKTIYNHTDTNKITQIQQHTQNTINE